MTPNIEEPHIVRSKQSPTPILDCSVGEFFCKQIENVEPNRIALIDGSTGQELTYGQLASSIHELAVSLVEYGVQSTDKSIFYSENSIDYVIGYLSVIYLGLTISPISPANGQYETGKQLSDIGANVLFVSADKLKTIHQMMDDIEINGPLIAGLRMLVILDHDGDNSDNVGKISNHPNSPKTVITIDKLLQLEKGKQLKSVPYFPVNPKTDHQLIVYTSGSTGLPKGAIHTHRSLLSMLFRSATTSEPPTIMGHVHPFGHISGSVRILSSLCNRMTGILFSNYTDQQLLRSIEKYRIVLLPILPGFSLTLCQTDYTKQYDLGSLRIVNFAGTKYPQRVVDYIRTTYRVMVTEAYGATEYFGGIQRQPNQSYPSGCSGVPMANVEMKIVDLDSGKNLPANQDGEICFRGPRCFAGYLNNPRATAEAIDQDGWYHSGDVGHYDTGDHLFITGRIKELIKYKHWSVAPVEIEQFLHTHPAVLVACVIGVAHQTEGYHLRAYVRLADGKSATEPELMDYVKENMGYQKRLNGGVRFVDHIPRTIIGKVDRIYFKNLVKEELLIELAEPQKG